MRYLCQSPLKGLETLEGRRRGPSWPPGYQQKGTSRYRRHEERSEVMIIRLTAQWAFFFHSKIVFHLVGESQTIGYLRPRIKGGQRIPECAWHCVCSSVVCFVPHVIPCPVLDPPPSEPFRWLGSRGTSLRLRIPQGASRADPAAGAGSCGQVAGACPAPAQPSRRVDFTAKATPVTPAPSGSAPRSTCRSSSSAK